MILLMKFFKTSLEWCLRNIVGIEPLWIDKAERVITDISEGIEATSKADGVTGDVAASVGVIIPVPVVMESGFLVEILPWVTQVKGDVAGIALFAEEIKLHVVKR